jgi:hypothetical protein
LLDTYTFVELRRLTMNLKALRSNVKNLLDYSPELQAFNDQVDELINEAYLHIWTYKRWSFAQKEKLFKFLPDITPSRDHPTPGSVVSAGIVQGARDLRFNASMDRLTPLWEGQPVEISGFEYTISKVLKGATDTIYLDQQYHGPTLVGSLDWKIKHRYYDLEQDCLELLSLAHRDAPVPGNGSPAYGKLIGLMARRDEDWNLRMDYTASFAEGYILSAPQFVPPAEKTIIANIVERGLFPNDGFPENTFLEVCWAFERDGHVGALSEPVTVSFPDNPQATPTYAFDISFASWDDQAIVADTFQSQDKRPAQYEGLRKVVYWNANYNRATGERLGLPCWKEFNKSSNVGARNNDDWLDTVKAEDTEAFVTIERFDQIDPGNATYIEYDGHYQRIRPYPRVDGWDVAVPAIPTSADVHPKLDQDLLRFGVQRYFYKPELLTKATDSPQLPYEFHQLIVYRALEQTYLKLGSASMSDIYRRRIEDAMKDLQKRYVDKIDLNIRRGQFGVHRDRWIFDSNSLTTLG